MIFGGLALLLGTAGPPTSVAYPLVEVLNAARAMCDRKFADQPSGWMLYSPESEGWFGRYVARMTEGGGALKVTSRTFRSTVAGRQLYALVAKMDFTFAPGKPVYSCEVFDPDAPALDGTAIRSWARRAPRRSSGDRDAWFYARWEPGLGKGFVETSITSIGAGTQGSLIKVRPGLAYSSFSGTKGRR